MTQKKGTKQNVTVSLDQQTIRRAKVLAARRGTSIAGFLARQIEMIVAKEEAYERAKGRAMALLDQGFHLGGARPVSRDELHQR